MNLTTYFLKHPVIALIFNTLLGFVGFLCLNNVNLRDYPRIEFPKIQVETAYPNASAQVVETEVTNPLEDRLAGISGIDTIMSHSKPQRSHITLNFKEGTVMSRALFLVREALALVHLPKEVKSPIVSPETSEDGNAFMIISVQSTRMNVADLTHYAKLNLENTFKSLAGVARAEVWGQPYIREIQLHPHQLYAYGINVDTIMTTMGAYNTSLPSGQFQNKIPVTLKTSPETLTDLENLPIKMPHHVYRLRDMATVVEKPDDGQFRIRVDGKPGLCIGIYKSGDANPLEVAKGVKEALKTFATREDVRLDLVLDQSTYVESALYNVMKSLVEAIVLVGIVVFLSLRNFKATLVPLITIPLSLLGSCIFLSLFGCSLNIMTLFAMVLAIGLVVDDAIVMLENIQRYATEHQESAIQAAIKGAKEITFPIIAMTFTLVAVYAPLMFMKGPIGYLFSEFAIALSGSVVVSLFVALTLSPSMSSCLLTGAKAQKSKDVMALMRLPYERLLTRLLQQSQRIRIVIFVTSMASVLGGIGYIFTLLPMQLAPSEDRSTIGVSLPPIPTKGIDAADHNMQIIEKRLNITEKIPEALHRIVFIGDWGAQIFLPLRPKEQRTRSAAAIVEMMTKAIADVPSFDAYPGSDDCGLPGLEDGGSDTRTLTMMISTTESFPKLFQAVHSLQQTFYAVKTMKNPLFDLTLNTKSFDVIPNLPMMAKMAVSPQLLAQTIAIFFSGDRSLDFFKDGVRYDFWVKGDTMAFDITSLYITNAHQRRVSLAALCRMQETAGPAALSHYNQMRSTGFSATLKPGMTMDQGMKIMEQTAREVLPSGYQTHWAGQTKFAQDNQNTALRLFVLSLIFVYCLLAIQFESFKDPMIILLTAPLACLGGLLAMLLGGQSLNIYTQIGLITLTGLITKHGVLMVEFINHLKKEEGLVIAIIQGSALRLRPIIMTTSAMVLGVIPFILASGAGSEPMLAIGVVLCGGLLVGTVLTIFLLPLVYQLFYTSYR